MEHDYTYIFSFGKDLFVKVYADSLDEAHHILKIKFGDRFFRNMIQDCPFVELTII